MVTNIWNKYLPVLRIVLKRSMVAEQQFALNAAEFERVYSKRKAGYKFLIKIKDGRLDNIVSDMPFASSLATALLADEQTSKLFDDREFHISMNAKYQLTVKYISHHKQPAAEAVAV